MSALLQTPLPALNDPEGAHVPESLPDVIDAHVHLFPDQNATAFYSINTGKK